MTARLMRRVLLVALIAACSDAKDKPPAVGDAGGGDRPADDTGSVETPAADSGSIDRPVAADTGDMPVDPRLMCDPQNEELWQSMGMAAGGQVRWVLNRCARNVCAGGCAIGIVYFALTYNGRTDAAKGKDIAYTMTHHNWNDSLIATRPDRVLKWRIVVDEAGPTFQPKYFVSVETPAGVPVLPEIETNGGPCLPPTDCGG